MSHAKATWSKLTSSKTLIIKVSEGSTTTTTPIIKAVQNNNNNNKKRLRW